jgi:hypothetical protein
MLRFAAGVGHNPDSFAFVRGANVGCGEHFPLRIIPDLGQRTEAPLEEPSPFGGEEAGDVLEEEVVGSKNVSCTGDLGEKVTGVGAGEALARERMGLAREPASEDVHAALARPFDAGDVAEVGGAREVLGEHARGVFVDFGKPGGVPPHPFSGKGEPADAAEQITMDQRRAGDHRACLAR